RGYANGPDDGYGHGCSPSPGRASGISTLSGPQQGHQARFTDILESGPAGGSAPEGGAEERPALSRGGPGGTGVTQGVQHDEVVDGAVVADRGDRNARVTEPGSVRLTLVAQHVGLAVDDQRGRQPGQVLRAGAQRGSRDLGASRG